MQKYRIRIKDNNWASFIFPLYAFATMNGDGVDYELQIKKGWWIFGKWYTIHKTHNKEDIYIHLMKDIYDIEIPVHFDCKWNEKHKWFTIHCDLKLYTSNDNSYFIAGYSDGHKYWEKAKSSISMEDALQQLYSHLQHLKYKHDVKYGLLYPCSTFGDTF